MSPLRTRMIEDMSLAGLATGTQKIYVQAVRRLAAHYRRSPDLLSEEEVRGYLPGLRQRGGWRAVNSRPAGSAFAFSITIPSRQYGDCSGKKGSPRHNETAA